MKMLSAVFYVTLMVDLLVRSDAQDYCYADDNNPFLEFGTKTAYEHVYNREGIQPLEGCKPVQLWLLSRHGTRYPMSNEIDPLAQLEQTRDIVMLNYKSNQTKLCEKDINNLRDWQFSVTAEEAETLTTQGEYDLFNLARRLKTYFPELLNTFYSPEKFHFRYSDTVRTKTSAEYFAKGLFGLNFDEPLSYSVDDDLLLHANKYCPAWNNDNMRTQEKERWDQSPEVRGVVRNVSRRLGFGLDLPLFNVSTMYSMCRYQKAWQFTEVSPWCAVFSADDLQVMEYGGDLRYYYSNGPGNAYTMRLACPLIKDLVDHFRNMEVNPQASNPQAFLYFSHDNFMSMVFSRIGLEPVLLPPTADNYREQQYRQFRTSRFVPFATNLLAVLYNCTGGQLKTVLYHGEYPITLTGCRQSVCDWNYVKKWFGLFVNDTLCTDNSYCFSMAYSQTSPTLTTHILLLFLALGTLLNKVK